MVPFVLQTKSNTQCGIAITASGARPQRLMTMGSGETETETCGRLIAIGRAPAPPGVERVVLLYRNRTSYAGGGEAYISPVAIRRTARTQNWSIDVAASAKLSEAGVSTVASARTVLGRR